MTTRFQQLVYEKTRLIPKGSVTTYKEIAKAIGSPMAYRAVGNALNKNPNPIVVPCHRVVRSDLQVGGFSGDAFLKEALLIEEGVLFKGNKVWGKIFKLD